jgi:hypothetical protein
MVNRPTRLPTAGISIVCVYNDREVRRQCLDSSIKKYSGDVDIDFVPVNNTTHAFASAGAALNHGAQKARHDLVVFVHQDVYLHSIDRLYVAGAAFSGRWGLLGANGITSQSESVGRLRDRTQLIGRSAPYPVDVESVDEVLFMVPRELVLQHPLAENADLAWHAYAVEYCLRLRLLGKRVGALDLAVTHNSLTINLDKLDVAHRYVGAKYPQLRPIRTTCGAIGVREPKWRNLPAVRKHGWRVRWLRQSLLAAKVRAWINAPVVLSDIRHEVDLLSFSDESPLYLFNVDRSGGFAEFALEPLRLTRYGRPVVMQALRTTPELFNKLDDLPRSSRVLIMGLELDDLKGIGQQQSLQRDWLIGIHQGALWLLGGAAARELPNGWSQRQAVPLGFGH